MIPKGRLSRRSSLFRPSLKRSRSVTSSTRRGGTSAALQAQQTGSLRRLVYFLNMRGGHRPPARVRTKLRRALDCHQPCRPPLRNDCQCPLLRWLLESRLFHATRSVRYLQFLSEHRRRCRDASKSREVQRVCRKIGRGSRIGDRSRQIRVRFGKADGRLRPRDLERPGGRGALLGILDRATKPVGRSARKLLRRLVQELRNGTSRAFS